MNPASHPSSYVTAQSVSLGDVGSIVFETDGLVAVVTRIADKVLLAAVGPSKLETRADGAAENETRVIANGSTESQQQQQQSPTSATPSSLTRSHDEISESDAQLEAQYDIDRSTDLARLASLNLSSSPAILLALESKSAALGRFLSQKLEDLEAPEDF